MLLLLACLHTASPPAGTATPSAAPPASNPTHGAAAARARDALLFSDFATWSAALRQAAADPSLPASARGEFTLAAAAKEPGAASEALGDLTASCASCHTRSGADIPAPAAWTVEGDSVRAEMERHAQGLDQLWFGLIRPSSADVNTGAETLRRSLLYVSRADAGGAGEALDDEVTRAANSIASGKSAAERGDSFGRMLRACMACHALQPGGLTLEPD